MDAFFEPAGDGRYFAGPFTGGPWDPRMQHGGPVSALLARALTDHEPVDGQQLARVSFELLRPVPIGPMRISTRTGRAGRKVSLVDAVLTDDDGSELILARAWRLQPTPPSVSSTLGPSSMPPASSVEPADRGFEDRIPGFMRGVEVRFTSGHFSEQGPGAAWFRLRVPLVEGTPMRATDPVCIAADCGNGISGVLDFTRYVYINPDLTVHLARLPDAEWVGLEAETVVSPDGISVATGRLQDARGQLGRTIQTLFVAER